MQISSLLPELLIENTGRVKIKKKISVSEFVRGKVSNERNTNCILRSNNLSVPVKVNVEVEDRICV